MQEGDVILTPVPQANGQVKNRPAVVLKALPPFQDLLVCGVSTQLQQQVKDFDEIIDASDANFRTSGLLAPSLIRLGFLAVLPQKNVAGAIGKISPERHERLLRNLSGYLLRNIPKSPNT
jgi:mRNA interferase MazF